MPALTSRRCVACEGGIPALTPAGIQQLLTEVPAWALVEDGRALSRTFTFPDYWETMAFVNAVAFLAHREDHHPDLSVHYSRCVVRWSTHAVGGLTDNDFIGAAKVSALLEGDLAG